MLVTVLLAICHIGVRRLSNDRIKRLLASEGFEFQPLYPATLSYVQPNDLLEI